MNKEFLKLLNGEVNAIKQMAIFSIEKYPTNDIKHVFISDIEGCEVFEFNYNPNKKKPTKKRARGGVASYLKLYISKINELIKQGVTPDLIGYVICVSLNIRWDDDLLIDLKTKKPLKHSDLQEIFGASRAETTRIISQLKDFNLLKKDKDGYKAVTNFIRKGGEPIENKDV